MWGLALDGSRRELEVEEFWPHKCYLVLKFAGIDSISDAEGLIGRELQVPAAERAKLQPGLNYVRDVRSSTGIVKLDRFMTSSLEPAKPRCCW